MQLGQRRSHSDRHFHRMGCELDAIGTCLLSVNANRTLAHNTLIRFATGTDVGTAIDRILIITPSQAILSPGVMSDTDH